MQNYCSIFNSKASDLQSSYRSLAASSVNYFQQEAAFKKMSQSTNEKRSFDYLSANKTKDYLNNDKPNLFKRTSIDSMKKSIYPSTNYATSFDGKGFFPKDFKQPSTLDSILKQKSNINIDPKLVSSRNSLNVNSLSSLKLSVGGRSSYNFVNQNTNSHLSPDKKCLQFLQFKSQEKSPAKKSPHNKQNFGKCSHVRQASSYAHLTQSPNKFNKSIFSTPKLHDNPSFLKSDTKFSSNVKIQPIPIVQKLSFEESQQGSRVNISIPSSDDQREDNFQMTARFNFAEERKPVQQRKDLKGTSTSVENRLIRSSNKKCISLSQFILGPCKGKGRYGKVFMAIERSTGFIYALKQIPFSVVRPMLPQFINELKTQSFLNHAYITKVYGYFVQNENIYLIMEYMINGNLYETIKKSGPLPQPVAATKLHQISQGLKYMHSYHVIHRDLKPQNIVINFNVCKICDFSWAVKCDQRRQTNCGTLDYLSPQMIEGNGYSSSIDLWAMGVLLYEMLVGKPPFYNISIKQTAKNIKQCSFVIPQNLSKQSKSLIQCFLRKDPNERKQMDEILKHSFFQKVEQ